MEDIRIGEPNGPLQPRPEGDQEPDPPDILLLLRALRFHLRDLEREPVITQEVLDRNGALRRAIARWLRSRGED